LKGLSPSTPIILTVDQLPLSIKTHENERERLVRRPRTNTWTLYTIST
jgi:hypothetical protein